MGRRLLMVVTLVLTITGGTVAVGVSPATYRYDGATNNASTLSQIEPGPAPAEEPAKTPASRSTETPRLLPATVIAAEAGTPAIKAGSAGGPTAGKPFSRSVRDEELANNPSTCVYCRMETDRPQIDHVIPRSRGGNATIDNAQTTCPWCNPSKGARDYPVNPPPGYEGPWPPPWWVRN